jgi:hypothetical protein
MCRGVASRSSTKRSMAAGLSQRRLAHTTFRADRQEPFDTRPSGDVPDFRMRCASLLHRSASFKRPFPWREGFSPPLLKPVQRLPDRFLCELCQSESGSPEDCIARPLDEVNGQVKGYALLPRLRWLRRGYLLHWDYCIQRVHSNRASFRLHHAFPIFSINTPVLLIYLFNCIYDCRERNSSASAR